MSQGHQVTRRKTSACDVVTCPPRLLQLAGRGDVVTYCVKFSMKVFMFRFLLLLLVFSTALSACAKQEEKRVFDEVTIEAPRANLPAFDSHKHDGMGGSADVSNPHAAVGLPSPEEMMKNPEFFGAMEGAPDMKNPHAAVGLPSPEEMAKNPKSKSGMPTAMPGGAMNMQNLPAGMDQKPSLNLKWKLPVDWVQRESTGMRLATFSTGSDQNYAECTIISLGGGAGGLESNIVRWMGQVAIQTPPAAEFQKFLSQLNKFKTQDGSSATFIDLTLLQKDVSDLAPSILTTVVEFNDLIIFVKLSGPKAALVKNREKFLTFSKSLDIRE